MQNKQTKAFTLVELIVVITILAILGTIAFISFQGYSAQSRDSVRISDLSTTKTGLELFHIEAGKYPLTTGGFTVTYSGTTQVWTQGTLGEDTVKNIDKLDKKPIDPLIEKEYTYSLTTNRQEYELAGVLETGEIAFFANEVNAEGETEATAYVTGNYNGIVIKATDNGNCSVLATPSIVSSDNTQTDLETLVLEDKLVYSGYKNLPSTYDYEGSRYNTNGGFGFTTSNILAYSDTDSCKALYSSDTTGIQARQAMLTGIQNAYSGSIIETEPQISVLFTGDTEEQASLLVNNSLGGQLVVSTNSSDNNQENVIDTTPPTDYIAYYPLTGTADDFSGNGYHGTENGGLAYVSDVNRGSVSSFDGVDDYVDGGNYIKSLPTFSVSLWFKADNLLNTTNIIGIRDSNLAFTLSHDGFNILNVAGIQTNFTDTGSWHHVIITRNGFDFEFYLDDIFIGSKNVVSFYNYGTAGLNIGSAHDPRNGSTRTYFFDGKISNIKIFDKVLSEQEITNIYNAEKDTSSVAVNDGLVAYYPLKNNSMDNWYNQYDGVDDTGLIYDGSSVDMDVDKYIDPQFNPPITEHTYSFWLNIDSVSNGYLINAGGGSRNTKGELLYLNSDSTLSYHTSNNCGVIGSCGKEVFHSSTVLETNKWYHIVLYASNNNSIESKLYIDGVLDSSGNPILTYNGYSSFILGRSSAGIDGNLSNFRVYDGELNVDDISEIYNSEISQFGY